MFNNKRKNNFYSVKNCLFCKIINKKIPAEIIYDNEKIIVFKDINPKAPIHFLIVPKKHIISINHIKIKDKDLLGELFLVAQKIAKKNKIKGYKTVFNVGREGGQLIDHLHLHFLGGWKDMKEAEMPGMP